VGLLTPFQAIPDRPDSNAAVEPRIHPFYLTFSDPILEHQFQDAHCTRSLPIVRISLVMGVLLFTAFAFLDLWIVGDGIEALWIVRFALVCPMIAGILAISYMPSFRSIMQPALATTMLITGLGVVAMTAVIDQPGSYLYYAGILDTVIYCSCVIRLRFIYAAPLGWVLFGTYQIVALYLNPVPQWALMSNDFFFLTAVFIGMFAAYTQELYLRRSYLHEFMVLKEKARSETLAAKAMAASDAKSDFLAMISHELRTPLNAIIGFSELMSREMFGPLGETRYVAYAHDIHESGGHLLSIINNILDLTKAEAGKLVLEEELVDIQALIANTVRLTRPNAERGGINVMVDDSPELPLVRADARMMAQIAMNLISNAIKFTETGGRVRIRAEIDQAGDYAICFIDTGIGIAESDIPKVMESFTQVDSQLSRKYEGTGLGLPLARRMLELHGGRLEIESIVGAGTTVRAILPAARVVADTVPQGTTMRRIAN